VKLGIMGGSFDPIHFGHLRAAENAREALGLDRVAFVPASVPPHRAAPAAPPLDRWAMVALGISGSRAFVAWDGELRRDGPSYTVDTARQLLLENRGAELTLIVGADNLALLPHWKEPEQILALCTVAVVGRPGEGAPAPAGLDPARFVPVEGSQLPIASSALRERVREGRSVRYLVPDAVAGYIETRGLYR
jgi:nicotinate-nucleotide adenylyltransferase